MNSCHFDSQLTIELANWWYLDVVEIPERQYGTTLDPLAHPYCEQYGPFLESPWVNDIQSHRNYFCVQFLWDECWFLQSAHHLQWGSNYVLYLHDLCLGLNMLICYKLILTNYEGLDFIISFPHYIYYQTYRLFGTYGFPPNHQLVGSWGTHEFLLYS